MNNCSGRAAATGVPLDLVFDDTILSVAAAAADDGNLWIAPGFIDLQVNGFAGVDYNDPETSHEEIARSIQVLFSTGVPRFFPTVITGSPAMMEAALRNLSRAKDTLPEGEAIEGFYVQGANHRGYVGARG